MSQANVDLVVGLQPAADVDFTQLFRDDDMWAASVEGLAPFVHPDFECATFRFDDEKRYAGFDGLRALFLEWLAPWASYRAEFEEAIDLGDRVVVLQRAFGRSEGSTQEVKLTAATVWCVSEGKIAHIDFYGDRDKALKAVGFI